MVSLPSVRELIDPLFPGLMGLRVTEMNTLVAGEESFGGLTVKLVNYGVTSARLADAVIRRAFAVVFKRSRLTLHRSQ